MTTMMRRGVWGMAALAVLLSAQNAGAQLDPLLYVKRNRPNVLIAIDTSDRMQRDTNGDYLDANPYVRTGAAWEFPLSPDINDGTSSIYAPGNTGNYRRKYVGLGFLNPGAGGDKFSVDHIEIVGEKLVSIPMPTGGTISISDFDLATRNWIAKRAVIEAIARNMEVARFSFFRTRQNGQKYLTPPSFGGVKFDVNESPVRVTSSNPAWSAQASTTWRITRPVVSSSNGSVGGPIGPLVTNRVDGATVIPANRSIVDMLKLDTGVAGSLIPVGNDAANTVDAPVDNMLDDLKLEVNNFLIPTDTQCRNSVVVLILGGGEGNTTNENPVAKAQQFLAIVGHRVPIYVIGIAPFSAAERTQLEDIASKTGGRFTEITNAMYTATPVGQPVPELVQAINLAVANAFVAQTDFDKPPDPTHPYGYETEHQVTSPIIGTVNLEGANDMAGVGLVNTVVNHPVTNQKIPQRSNLMLTTGFALPGFDGRLRAFRVYKPVADSTKSAGYRFDTDGSRLWVGAAPAAASRNIYTALPNGTVVAFTSANAAALRPYLRAATNADAANLIDFVRAQPLGAVMGSTPAIMDAPSLDPPPDSDYPGFQNTNKDRRTMIWVGANDGMLHGIDGRLGKEVWAFIPFNLLPKLSALPSGQPVGDFRFYVDGSPKVADVKVGGQWRSYLIMGEGAGGTFYQTFDVTLDNMAATAQPQSDNLADVLSYFANPASVPLKWQFPSYTEFDVNLGAWGELAATASPAAKTVGETWSDPAVGQIEAPSSPYVVLTGSGFLKYSVQQSYRGGVVAGTTFYMLDAETGNLLDSRSVGNDGKGETIDNCAAAAVNNCTLLKNALQVDPVATGPADSRYITRTYLGDLDGKIWRFDLGLNTSGVPTIKGLVSLYSINTGVGGSKPSDHPVFSSMATVSVGASQQYLFVGTGSDLMPRNGINTQYALLVIQDVGTSGALTSKIMLEATDGLAGDEKVSAFPAVAGDIVFFTTTTYKATGCLLPDANLYAFTFIGGPAYDTNGDGTLTGGGGGDSTKVRSVTGSRGTAPFIVDQHLVFGVGNKVEAFGDPQDFNNGVGQAGVRILSWREVR